METIDMMLVKKIKRLEQVMEVNRKQCAEIAQVVNRWGKMRQEQLDMLKNDAERLAKK